MWSSTCPDPGSSKSELDPIAAILPEVPQILPRFSTRAGYFGFVGFLAPKNVDLGVEFKALSYLEAEIMDKCEFSGSHFEKSKMATMWIPVQMETLVF